MELAPGAFYMTLYITVYGTLNDHPPSQGVFRVILLMYEVLMLLIILFFSNSWSAGFARWKWARFKGLYIIFIWCTIQIHATLYFLSNLHLFTRKIKFCCFFYLKQVFALKNLHHIVDIFWAEISESVDKM